MAELVVGVEGYRWLASSGIGRGLSPRSKRVPVTPLHAVRPGEEVALCGQALHEVTGMSWPRMGSCRECVRVERQEGDDGAPT